MVTPVTRPYEDIVYEKAKGVARITINRPRIYNAFRGQTTAEMVDAFGDAADDGEIGVIVLTGAERNFSTGGDVKWEGEFTPAAGRHLMREMAFLANSIRNAGKPVIAAVDGYCVGGGNELNMLCDLTIATESAKFGQAGPRMGSVPIWWGTQLLPLSVGEKRAREIVYLCKQYSAKDAYDMGWVNRVVPDGDLDQAVQEWCDEILDKSPNAIRLAKTSINFMADQLTASVNHGGLALSLMHGSEEFREGTTAFTEKRKPEWGKFRGPEF